MDVRVESMNVLGDGGVAVASIVEFLLSRKVAPTSKCLMCYVMLILRFDSCLGGDAGVYAQLHLLPTDVIFNRLRLRRPQPSSQTSSYPL